jgi:streptogramin lyase
VLGCTLLRVRARGVVALVLVGALIACGRSSRPSCHDADHDGYGVGCAKGPDCDDRDPSRASQCDDAGVVDCELESSASGCPCLGGGHDRCFSAPLESMGVGVCRAGTTQCVYGAWSACEGAVLPGFEICNGLDDDCDGSSDEGVQSPCGGCNAGCTGGVWGEAGAPFVAEGNLVVTAAGELTLRRDVSSALTLWVPNSDEGTVSKIDVGSAREVARYRTRGANPIRAAVDRRGDVWVLDGSQLGQSRLTKLAGALERCADRNGDGLRTSQRPDDVLPLGADECVLLDLPLGAAGDDARSLALDGAPAPDSERAGNVWVGLAAAQRLIALDGSSGAQIASVELPEFHAYAGAFDAWGVLWLLDRDGFIASVDSFQQPLAAKVREVPFGCYALEGFSLDAQGRLLLSGFGCESVLCYDPQRDRWQKTQVGSLLSPRGMLSLPAASWVGYESGSIASVVSVPLGVGATLSLASGDTTPYETIALASDTLGQLWAVSTQGGPAGRGVATRVDPDTTHVTAQVPVGLGPRGGGDLSGSAFAANFAPEGQATHVFLGCAPDGAGNTGAAARTQWKNVHVASLSAGASVEIAVRHADQEQQLAAATFRVLGTLPQIETPFALDLPDGGVLEVRLVLRSPGALGAPRVARVGVEWRCPGPD